MWDASALVKRYAPETGSDTADALFDKVPGAQMVATVLGYAEAYSILLRKRNQGRIPISAFAGAKTLLRQELLGRSDFVLLTIDDAAIFAGITFMERHNLNATDAALLALFIRYAPTVPDGLPSCTLIA